MKGSIEFDPISLSLLFLNTHNLELKSNQITFHLNSEKLEKYKHKKV